jgi:Flp pilus assembly protein TadB
VFEKRHAVEKKGVRMSLAKILIVLAVIGSGLWAVNVYAPVSPAIKALINFVLVVVLCLWLLKTFGVISSLQQIIWRR